MAETVEAESIAPVDKQAEPTPEPLLVTQVEAVVAADPAVTTDAASPQGKAAETSTTDNLGEPEPTSEPDIAAIAPEPALPVDAPPAASSAEAVGKAARADKPAPAELRATAVAYRARSEAGSSLAQSYEVAVMGIAEINARAVDALRANSVSALEFFESLMGARSLSEAIRLQTEHARKQFEVVTGQAKELTTLARRVVHDTAHPPKPRPIDKKR